MIAPVELQLSLADIEELHRLAAPKGARLPPHSARVPGPLLARVVADRTAMFRRLAKYGEVAEPEMVETP